MNVSSNVKLRDDSSTDFGFLAKAFAIMPFVWSIGTIIGPAVGKYPSLIQYPCLH